VHLKEHAIYNSIDWPSRSNLTWNSHNIEWRP
jgi:hypothetical protein